MIFKIQIRGRDDVTWHHLNGLSFFSSTADDREEKLMGALGFYNSGNKYSLSYDINSHFSLYGSRTSGYNNRDSNSFAGVRWHSDF